MTQRFHAVEYRLQDGVAVLTLNNPPVNGLSHAMRVGLVQAFEHAIADSSVTAIVLTGAGKAFSAGGDIREFGSPAASAAPGLSLQVHPVIEASPKITVAAIHGIAMGGGLETALVCHHRIAAADTRIALPEIQRGLIPLSGTQRLPRVLGLQAATDFILEAKTLLARDFASNTLFDAVLDVDAGEIVQAAVQFAQTAARTHRKEDKPLPLIRHRPIVAENAAAILASARLRASEISAAATGAVDAIAAAVEGPDFDSGLNRAREIFDRLASSDEVRAQRDRFFAARSKS